MARYSQAKSAVSEGYDEARAKAAEEEMLRQKAERLRMEELQGKKIISSEQKKAILEKEARNKIYNEAIETGKTAEQAAQEVADSGIGSITPNLDRFRAENRKLAESRQAKPEQELGGFKTYGDKATFEAKNAIRKLRGQEPLPEPLPANKQFLVDLEKSASFGAESALVGSKAPKGQARAFEAGIRAGYTPEETRKLISDTAARITGVVDNKPAATPAAPVAPTPTEPTATPSKFVSDFMAATPQKPIGPFVGGARTADLIDKSFFGALKKPQTTVTPVVQPAQPQQPPTVKQSNTSSNLNVRFGEMPFNEKTSQAEKYRRLLGEGYTPKQAAEISGIPEYQPPTWLQGTGLGSLLKAANTF